MEETLVSTTYSPDSANFSTSKVTSDYQPYQLMKVSLVDEDGLWSMFNSLGTEMIVTRSGRQIFPGIKLSMENLSPYKFYKVYMEIAPVDGIRYRYNKHNWVPKGTPETAVLSAWIEHPQSPAEGYRWMIKPVDFNVKLTNCLENVDGETAYLRSMYKYKIIIHVEEGCNMTHRNQMMTRTFPLINTTFMSVTTYHNPEVKELKTATNIHAKGIRHKKQRRVHDDVCDDVKRFSKTDSNTTSNPLKRPRLETDFNFTNVQRSFATRNEPIMNQMPNTVSYLPKWNDFYTNLPDFWNRRDSLTMPVVPKYQQIEAPAIAPERIPLSIPLSVYCPPPYFPLDCPPYYDPLLLPMYPQRCPYSQPVSSHSTYSTGYPTYQDRSVSSTCGSVDLNICPSCRDGFHNCVACAMQRRLQNSDQVTPPSNLEAEISSTFQQQRLCSAAKSSPSPTPDFPACSISSTFQQQRLCSAAKSSPSPTPDFPACSISSTFQQQRLCSAAKSSPSPTSDSPACSQSDTNISAQPLVTDVVSSSIAESVRLQF